MDPGLRRDDERGQTATERDPLRDLPPRGRWPIMPA